MISRYLHNIVLANPKDSRNCKELQGTWKHEDELAQAVMPPSTPRIAFYQRKRFLVLCVCGLTLYQHRQRIYRLLHRAYSTATGALNAAETTATTLVQASNDLRTYLHADPSASQPVPRSLRRLLRMLASPEGLVMLRSAAAGAAGVAMKELSKGKGRSKDPDKNWIQELVKIGLSSGGSKLISLVITEAVREVTSTILEYQSHQPRESGKQPLELMLSAALSERGETIIVQTAKEVTKVAIPLLMQGTKHDHSRHSMTGLGGHTQTLAQVNNKRRPQSARYPTTVYARDAGKSLHSPKTMGAVTATPPSPRSRRLLATALAMSGQKSWIEKLIVLASRDPSFIHGALRVVASEAIRTYLTTQAELKFGHMRKRAVKTSLPGDEVPAMKQIENGGKAPEPNYVVLSKSMWRVLVRSVVMDTKEAFQRLLKNPPEPRWIFF